MNIMTAEQNIHQHSSVNSCEWINVCEDSDLSPDTGVCALVKDNQVAIFKSRRLDQHFAISNYDPIGEANVLSRGIIGSIGDAVVVASPLYKQHFNLRTGECLEKPEYKVSTFPVRVHENWIQVYA